MKLNFKIFLLVILITSCRSQKHITLSNDQIVAKHQKIYEQSVAERCNTYELFCPSLRQSYKSPKYSLILKYNYQTYAIRKFIGFDEIEEYSIHSENEIFIATYNDSPYFEDILLKSRNQDQQNLFGSVSNIYKQNIHETKNLFSVSNSENIDDYLIIEEPDKREFLKHFDSKLKIYKWSEYRKRMFKYFIENQLTMPNEDLEITPDTRSQVINIAMQLNSLNSGINKCPETRELFTTIKSKVDSTTLNQLKFEYLSFQFAETESKRAWLKKNDKLYKELEQCFIWDLCKPKDKEKE